MKVKKEGAKLDNLPMGRRINVRNAFRGDGKIFYKRKLPDDSMDIAIAILNDESGSMSSKQRITYARSASIILYDFCRSLNIPIAVYGHTECYDVDLFAYAEFDSVDGNDKFRMMDMSARDGNRDGAALRFVAERLMTRPEPCKLLFIIPMDSLPEVVVTLVLQQKRIFGESRQNMKEKALHSLPQLSGMINRISNGSMGMVLSTSAILVSFPQPLVKS